MELDLPGGSDVGLDLERDIGDSPPSTFRDTAPDYLSPINASAPVSGHARPAESATAVADSPEHDWDRARVLIYPAFRPVGTLGLPIDSIDREAFLAHPTQSHSQPLLDQGLAELPVVYTIAAGGFDIVVNGDHLLSWGVEPAEIQDAAMRNLATWSATAPWSTEDSGDRHLISSQTGDGFDAVRILLPEVVAHLVRELGSIGRILVGVPERDLLIAGSTRDGDDDFAGLFTSFIVEHSGGADEPIDRRAFELREGRLIEFNGPDAAV
jgi:Protein of unknown function (DUF1444)